MTSRQILIGCTFTCQHDIRRGFPCHIRSHPKLNTQHKVPHQSLLETLITSFRFQRPSQHHIQQRQTVYQPRLPWVWQYLLCCVRVNNQTPHDKLDLTIVCVRKSTTAYFFAKTCGFLPPMSLRTKVGAHNCWSNLEVTGGFGWV